jgi:hypothetical protein
VGASNLKHSLPHFAAADMDFEDIKLLGWTASVENVAKMTAEVGKKSTESAAFVFNILSYGSVRSNRLMGQLHSYFQEQRYLSPWPKTSSNAAPEI